MAGSDHLVVDEFFFCSQMTFKAEIGTVDNSTRVAHAYGNGFFARPIASGVGAEPGGGGTVAGFAGDTFGDFKRAAALLGRGVKSVAGKTLGGYFRFSVQLQDVGHALADIACEGLVGTAMLVLKNPGGIFVLEDAATGDGLDTAMAAGCGARTGTDVFHRLVGAIGRGNSSRRNEEESGEDELAWGGVVVATQHEVRQKKFFLLIALGNVTSQREGPAFCWGLCEKTTGAN